MTDKNNEMKEEYEEHDMAGIGTDTAGVLALLADTNRAGRGNGVWGGGAGEGGGYYGAPYANQATIQHGLENNRQTTEDQTDCLKDAFGAGLDRVSDQAEESRRSAQFTTIIDNINNTNNQNRDGQFQAELRNGDRMRDIEREMNANARAAEKCCCELKTEILKENCATRELVTAQNAATRELINQNTIRAAVDQNNISATVGGINAAAAGNTAAIIAAIQGINGHHHR